MDMAVGIGLAGIDTRRAAFLSGFIDAVSNCSLLGIMRWS